MRTIKEHRSNTSQACICATTRDGGPPPGSTRLDAGFPNKNNTVHGNPGKGLPSTARIHIIGYMIQFFNSHNREAIKSRTKASKPDHGLFPALLPMKQVFQFIISLFTGLKISFFRKVDYAMNPVLIQPVQDGISRKEDFNILTNLRMQVLVKILAVTGWNYSQSSKLNKISIAETLKVNFNHWGTRIVLPISLFLLVVSGAYAAPANYTVVGIDKFNGADGAGNSISQNATALGNAFNAIIRNGSTNDFTFDCGVMATNSEDQPKGAIIFRYTSASSFYAVTYHRDLFGTGNYMVRLKLNTLNSPLSSTGDLASYTIPGGGGVTSLKVTVAGSSIQVTINGTLRINVTNSALPSGSYGFGVGPRFNSDDVVWNNVVWTAAASGPSASTQDFGTGTTGFGGVNVTSTTYLPNPTPAGTTFVRSSNGTGGGLQFQNSSALGTTGSILRATASTDGSVVKVTPILNNTAGKVAYARFKAMFGNSTGGNTAASGIWQMFLGNGSGYSDANGFTSNQTNVGLQFTYGASGAITMNYRNNGNWSTTSLTSNPLYQSVYYDFEIFSNNKSSGTENYTYNGVSSSVAVGKFDLYVNGRIIGNELTDGELASNADITSIMFTGSSSTSNVANIFIDDVALHNTIPATTTRLTNPAVYNLSSANYNFTSWANTNSVGTTPSNMKFHWSQVNSQNPTLAQSNATQDYVWGYNYTMNDSRISGLGNDGIEFLQANTGHSSTSSGNLGDAVVSINTSNRQDVNVSWSASLKTDNAVSYRLRGQYRVGNTGAYTDLPGTTAAIDFNSNGATVGTNASYGPITLPAACNNQSEVQIRWVYYWGGSGTGAGDGIRLDEISISSVCFAPVATAGTALTAICQGGTSAALGGSVASPATAGTWSTPAGGTFSPSATDLNATWTPPAAYSGTATLTLTTSGGSCGTATGSKTLVVTPTNTPGTASSNPTICLNTALTNITRTTTGATGISNNGVAGANGLPAGVSAAWASNTITISGTPTAAGTFNYSIPLTGGCGAVTASGSIIVNGLPSVSLGADLSICSGVTTGSFSYSSPTNGADQYSIAWTAAGTSAGLSNVGLTTLSGGTISLTGLTATAGNYPMVVTIRNSTTGCSMNIGNPICGTANEAGSLTLTTPTGVFHTIDFASYGNPNGTCDSYTLGTCHAINSLSIVSTAALGNSSFTIAASNAIFGEPCINTAKRLYVRAYSGMKLTVIPTSVGGTIAGSASKCANNSGTLLTLSGYTGSIVKWQSSTSSTFASAVTDIVNTAATYTTPANLSATTYYRAVLQSGVCATANSATATITITKPGSGNFSYASAGYCTSSSTVAVGTSNFTGVTGAFSSTAGLSINSSTGLLAPSSSTAGNYVVTYTIPASGGCALYSTTTNVIIDRAGSGTIVYSTPSVCTGLAGTISPTITGANGSGVSVWYTSTAGLNLNATNGQITPSTSGAGVYTVNYHRSASAYCPAYVNSTTVTINSTPGITSSTPAARCGTGSVQLGATSASGTVYWYDVASGGISLGSGVNFNTPTISANTTYYAEAVASNGCVTTTRTAVLATVNAIPTITATTPNSRCGTGTVVLGATASAGTLNWYDAATGGTLLGTGTSFTTPSISVTGDYFVGAVSGAGCTSAARTMVTATVKTIPSITSTTPGANCGTGTVALSALASAGTISWFSVATGGTALATSTNYTTPSISSTTNYYVEVTNNGCTSGRTMVAATISTTPSVSSSIAGNRCGAGSVTMFATPSAGATLKWYTASTGGSLLATGNSYTVNLSASTTYYVQASVGTCLQPSRTAITANINAFPTISVTANYCSVPGFAVLTATAGMNSYLWNTGQTTQAINVDQAGVYNVIGTTAAGCADTATFGVATELVTNGSFDAGNTGFTTNYTYVADIAGSKSELYPEGTYAVVPDPNSVHNSFYGADRHGDGGNIMVINGAPALGTNVWNQNSTTVLPNTTYYFSAWAMSVVNGNKAILQFSINGNQVGTIAYLGNGYSNAAGPYNWVRFYGQWNSGSNTSANLSIVNLNLIEGGNDFAMDDISFGTMSPIALSSVPLANSGTAVCQGSPLVLNSEAIGGASPFTYAWTGPNGFTSTLENPQVTATASTTQNGTYNLTVTDGFGCTANSSVVVSVSALPASQTLSAAASSICTGGNTSINLASSEVGVYYQLRNNADNSSIGALVQGTGSAISLPTGVLSGTTTFNVLATRFPSNCDVEMASTITVSLATTPVLVITNQAACSGTVNLTAAGVTAGSTGAGTLSYWTDATATTSLTSPSAVAASGTYYIKSTNGACSDIQAVIVSINSNPTVTFTYSSATFCTTGSDPVPTLGGAAGVFTASPVGMVFVNNNTGEIDLSASAPGTYTVTNTVTPSGACAPKSATRTVTVSPAPLAAFNYISNDLCQSANALNASPIFEAGAAAGTFSSSAGLSITAATGVINVSASTPGNYAVVNTRAATSGCPSFADTTFLDINPYIFTGAVSASVSDDVICQNETVDLYSSASSYATVLLREKFNGSINNWVKTNNSTGGTPANAAWTLRDENYNYNGNNHSSNDDSRFYMSNSDAQGGGGNTSTILRSPVMSTVGFSTLSLDFFQYFDARSSGDDAKVQISTNNTTWTDLVTYTTDQGSRTGFANAVFNLNAYIGLPTVYIRFVYTASNDLQWAIDNVSVTGNSINYGYAWSSSPAGYTSSLQNPTALAPVTNSNYIVNATNGFGCSNPASPVPVTVNPLPSDNAGIDQNICGSGSVTIGDVATSGNTYAWSPATGLSDATVANPTASPGTTRTYTLTETIAATGCSDTNKVVLSVTPLPTITSSTDAGRCGTGTVTVSAVSSTGTMSWFSAAVGGASLGSGSSFTTPSISASTTYYVEATSATCLAASRTAVIASVNALPVISSQSTAAANYSQGQVASAMSVTASAGSGTISTYTWFSNASASNTGGSPIASSNSASHVPSTAVSGTLYYYCVVTNSNGCTTNSAVSGAVTTIVTPSFSVVSPVSPNIGGQPDGSGYKGQTINIYGSNFAANAQVTFNGVSAASVSVMNAGLIIAVVNNTGANSTGNLTVTNPSTGAFASTAFSFIGYITNGNSFDWSSNASWLGNSIPAAGADVTIRHNGTIGSGVTASYNRIDIKSGSTLTFATSGTISVVDMENNGTIQWTSTGTLNLGGTLVMSASGSFEPGNGTVVYNKAGDQSLVTGAVDEIEFNNLQLMGSGTKTLPAGMDLEVNNLSIGAGVTFNPGTLTSEILINGDVSIDGNLASSNTDLHFISAADQSISVAGAGTVVVSALRVNKASGTLLLNDNVRVMDSLTMISGNINTQGNMFEIGSSISSKGILAHTSGYIQGIVRRWYSGTNAGATTGMFPVGELKAGNVWENRNVQLNYTSAPSTGGHLTVEFMTVSMNANVTGTQTTIDSSATGGTHFNIGSFAEEGYWKIDNQAGTLIDGAYTIAITGENFTSIGTDLEMLSMVKRVSLGDWFAPGTHLAPTGDITMATLRRSGVSGFSNFGFGIAQPDIPLPVNVSSMSVDCGGLNPSFNWTTVQERDAKEFIVQQSADGKSWKDLGTVNAAGNSDRVLRYSFDLRDMNSQSAYVRIVLRNNDASLQAFNALAVSCKQGLKKEEMSLFPNPSKGVFSIDLKSINEGVMSVRVLNTLGIEVAGQLHNAARNNKVNMDIQGLPAGIYQVLVGPEGEAPIKSFKVVIN